jgi:dTDP-4-dehydrorhamnose 3,5-epimerase
MKLKPLGIDGAWMVESSVWGDERGLFREWFKRDEILKETGIDFLVQQANISLSRRGVIRGIHYSIATQGQAKWITCINGSIRDVILDIRPNSPTYGKHVHVNLDDQDGKAILISSGLGHGFATLANNSTIAYLLSSPYSPTEEFEINPMDPDLKIDWGINLKEVILSEKDGAAPSLAARLLQGKLLIKEH